MNTNKQLLKNIVIILSLSVIVGCGSGDGLGGSAGSNGLGGANGRDGSNGSNGRDGLTVTQTKTCPQTVINTGVSSTALVAYQEVTFSSGTKQVSCSINTGSGTSSETYILIPGMSDYSAGKCVINLNITNNPANDNSWSIVNDYTVSHCTSGCATFNSLASSCTVQ